MHEQQITMEISSSQCQVRLLATAARSIAKMASFTEDEMSSIDLCVTEAATNAIQHAYSGIDRHRIRVMITLRENKAVFDVCHQGNNSEQLQQALDSVSVRNEQELEAFMLSNLLKEEGRGLALIKYYMDDVKVVSESGWVCLSMIKNIIP